MNKLKDAIIGFAIGDAFGVPYEFNPRNCVKTREMIGYGTWSQPKGTWSDDTSMTLATLAAIRDKGIRYLRAGDVMKYFVSWGTKGQYTAHGEVFDIGGRTAKALDYYIGNSSLLLDNDINSNGNGSLMRILPFAFYPEMNEMAIGLMSSLTHPHEISKKACWIYIQAARYLLDHPKAFRKEILNYIDKINDDLLNMDLIKSDSTEGLESDGYVIHTLEAVIWALIHSFSFEEAILLAVNLGGDTDTIGALVGGLAGIYYGYDAIPKDWLNTLARRDYIEDLCEKALKSV